MAAKTWLIDHSVGWSARTRTMLQKYEQRARARRPVDRAWEISLAGEVAFWKRRFVTYQRLSERLDPNSVLQDEIVRFIDAPKGSTVRILDVGAGPLTWLGKTHPDWKIEVSAVDALGAEYGEIIASVGLEPPVSTQAGQSEKLSEQFEPGSFDLVYARNTLDHSYDPLRAIREILTILRPGGMAVLSHAENEAVEERYIGMHQWNFAVQSGRFVIWRPGTRIDVATEIADLGTMEVIERGNADDRAHDLIGIRRS